ncbi:hypothetical protein VNO77_23451 [Canavalia gladiata]|uniref:Uncharacterized protein n=1 Tax=Canavalia gladiata TaxID=3824 RepID=A0AAN9L591_CANGL
MPRLSLATHPWNTMQCRTLLDGLGVVFEAYGLQVELKATALLILEVLLSCMPLKQVRYELLGKKPLDRE